MLVEIVSASEQISPLEKGNIVKLQTRLKVSMKHSRPHRCLNFNYTLNHLTNRLISNRKVSLINRNQRLLPHLCQHRVLGIISDTSGSKPFLDKTEVLKAIMYLFLHFVTCEQDKTELTEASFIIDLVKRRS